MADNNQQLPRGKRQARVFWFLGIMAGILAGGFVAFGLATSKAASVAQIG